MSERTSPSTIASRIVEELAEHARKGEIPRLDEYLERYPDLVDRLHKVFADLKLPDDGAPTVADTAGGIPPDATPSGANGSSPHNSKVRCPLCHNPIQLREESVEVLCPGCGGSFRLREAQSTDTTATTKQMGKFQLLERLGIGGFGAVWKARDTKLDRIVALKIPHTGLMTNSEELERFQREARATAQLRHPNIVSVHEVDTLNNLPVIVSEFIAGVPLKDLLDQRRLTFRESAALTAQMADALEYAHSMGVVHRDVKPANIMLLRSLPSSQRASGAEGEWPAGPESASAPDVDLAAVGKPMLLDFGLALRDASEMTMTIDGHVLGTPAYMSPEQASGKSHQADRRSDVYSVGVVLYQLLTGELPFRGSRLMLLDQVIREDPKAPRKVNDRIPVDLETICLKCLAKSPAGRYATARELADDLRRFLRGESIRARPVGTFEQIARWCARNRAVASLAASILLILALGMTVTSILAVRAHRSDQAAQDALAELEIANRREKELRHQFNRFLWENPKAIQAPLPEVHARFKAWAPGVNVGQSDAFAPLMFGD